MTSKNAPTPSKRDVLDQLLVKHGIVNVYVDSRKPGVRLPDALLNQPTLMLTVGTGLPVPIRDLSLNDTGWSATLSFNRSPFFCVVPWVAVFALATTRGEGFGWPSDTPPEALQAPPAPEEKTATGRATAKGWRVLDGGKKDSAGAEAGFGAAGPNPPRTNPPSTTPPKAG